MKTNIENKSMTNEFLDYNNFVEGSTEFKLNNLSKNTEKLVEFTNNKYIIGLEVNNNCNKSDKYNKGLINIFEKNLKLT